MASKQVLVVIVVVTVTTILAAPAPALAADLLVRDSQGWRLNFDYDDWVEDNDFIVGDTLGMYAIINRGRLNFDYDDWVEDNDFIVGDTLVFKYAMGQHSVVQATAANYAACSQANSLGAWTSGDDRITLNTSGTWWFFCGVGDHCQQGMKFNVTVLPAVVLSPSSPPSRDQGGGDATGAASARGGGLAAAGLCVAAVAALVL